MAINFPLAPGHNTLYAYAGINYIFTTDDGLPGYWKTSTGELGGVASGAEVDTGTDNLKYASPKAMEDSTYVKEAYVTSQLAGYVTNASYTDQAVMDKMKNVDSDDSGLNANTTQGFTKAQLVALGNATGQLPADHGGTGATAVTGSGSNVLSTSPDMTAGNATVKTQLTTDNSTRAASTAYVKSLGYTTATGHTHSYAATDHEHSGDDITSGTVPVAYGGTGVGSSTGSSKVVLSSGPTLTGNVYLPTTTKVSSNGGMLYHDNASNVEGRVVVTSTPPTTVGSYPKGTVWLVY